MKITHLRVNHFPTPLGMALGKPIFSWVTEETASKRQAAAQIVVRSGGEVVYDTGRREDLSSLGVEADLALRPRARYDWTVTVWGDGGDSASAASWFETAKEDEPWRAQWIAAGFDDKEAHPLLAKDFTLPSPARRARAYVCGLGIYELEVNGRKIGDEYLLPGFHCYDANLEYQTFDVTGALSAGDNTIGLRLGPGWYKGDIVFDRYHNLFGDTMQAICELRITHEDGGETVIGTDGTWRCYPSPVTFSNIYDGEHYNANREIPGWSRPGCAAPAFEAVVREEKRPLVARLSPKIVKKREFSPIVLTTPAGETVLDFGQNMTGWVEFNADAPAGTEITLTYGEVLQNGNFYRDNLRSAKAEYRYLSDGKPRRVRPHFTFYGFRYVKVEGVERVRREDFTGCHIRSDIDPIGSIHTDDPRIDRLFLNALWGQFDNFLDIPTDCPQRDERLGWSGDAAIISATACKNLYMPAFFHHFIVNIGHEQDYYDGSVPFFIPAPHVQSTAQRLGIELLPSDFLSLTPDDEAGLAAVLEKYPALQALLEELPEAQRPARLEQILRESLSFTNNNHRGCAIWSDVATMMPWAVYENYGDKALLRREYPVMKTWVERVRRDDRADGDRGLWLRGEQLGDWLALDREDGDTQNPFGATDLHYTATAFYWYSTTLTAKAAKALGLADDQAEYEALAEKIKAAFLAEYFNADGSLKIHETQTACVLALFFQLYPEGKKDAVLGTLKDLIHQNNDHLNTGFCGTPFLCRALSDNGAGDLAYTLLLNEDYPSWLYEVNMGATTIWERWNSILPDGSISGTGMNSLNHYAYGSIADWMYRCLCGLNPVEDAPGYKKAVICPLPDPRLRWADLVLDSASGRYQVRWWMDGQVFHCAVTVPFDCEATLILPDGRLFQLSAGEYSF